MHGFINNYDCTAVKCRFSASRIGCPAFTEPIYPANPEHNKVTRSLFYPDEAIHHSHPRFKYVSILLFRTELVIHGL